MSSVAAVSMGDQHAWETDSWGQLNELPPADLDSISHVLEVFRTLPAFQEARRWLLDNLAVPTGGHLLEAGCGTGAALPDILAELGPTARVTGIDPTTFLVAAARNRAKQLGAMHSRYESGDIRAIQFGDGEFDATFCDKILLHVSPAQQAIDEMARVTRPGGRVGAVEWCTYFFISTTHPELEIAFNQLFRDQQNFMIIANLVRYFHAAGLCDVEVRPFLAFTRSLDEHPFWRLVAVQHLQGLAQSGQQGVETAATLAADFEHLDEQGDFSASFIVYAVVGTKSG